MEPVMDSSLAVQTTPQHSSLLNRSWRVIATAFCFMLFGLGGLLLSLLWFSSLRLIIRSEATRSQITQQSIRYSFQLFLRIARFLGVFDYQIENNKLFSEDTGCLIVANHPSLLDYVLLAAHMPRCDCIVKEALLNNIFVAGVIKSAGYLVNTESDRLLIHCKARLARGGSILIFPEGTRTTAGCKLSLQRGAANIALHSGCDIRIVYIDCNPPMLTKELKWYNIPPVKPQFNIIVQNKINSNEFIHDSDLSLALAARRLTKHLTCALMPESKRKS
ncbi:1-acyl-sn-glycerol-3-phosphate acyltransferase [Yersinia enterocolitica]|nr:1-acyl-sn-glycerol-3-phosphate acyltransferase [Yersinia enterocolitica]EKN5077961.1 1-acyl-sn-glycerol-3-phosphate acyltransferase [Yersinia enterocolitica]EKN6182987.1 1-acyl-sn-glycerol-3-phosphate acyltransferase [Yersinia enterocolitica]EKN6327742.1 1-acyl-sn-glycerol-3-phosphate acyltransferase [Yersinia enterocolitica]EKN6374579.1 1-acyl-sn-glycerol-3-phosphate acyltransferase [Yersinia enterocolitica]